MTKAYIEGFCKTAEAHGVDPSELMKVARKNDTRKNVATGAGIGMAAGSAYPMVRIPLDLHTANRLAGETLASLSPFERNILGPGGLDATVSSVKKMLIKGRIRQALMLGVPLSAVGGIAGYLKNKMN